MKTAPSPTPSWPGRTAGPRQSESVVLDRIAAARVVGGLPHADVVWRGAPLWRRDVAGRRSRKAGRPRGAGGTAWRGAGSLSWTIIVGTDRGNLLQLVVESKSGGGDKMPRCRCGC